MIHRLKDIGFIFGKCVIVEHQKLRIIFMTGLMIAGMSFHPQAVFAHSEDYIGETLVFQTLEAGIYDLRLQVTRRAGAEHRLAHW